MSTTTQARRTNPTPQRVPSLRSGLFITIGALALIAVGVFTIRIAIGTAGPVTEPARAAQAEAARWNGLAQMYAEQAADRERSLTAEAARWNGIAQRYAAPAANRERSLAAEAARWNGLAQLHATQGANP